jgi:CheY-like chemotaxis protein
MSVSLVDSAAPNFPSPVAGNNAKLGSSPRVLVADDDPRVLATVASFLTKAGFAVQKAADGEEALHAITGDPDIRLLVTDFSMPEMSGATLISEAIHVRPHLRALLMTGYPNAEGLARLPSDVPVLVKPFRRTEFLAKIDCLADEIREAEQV